jgi:hypothetical protein
MTEQKQRDEDTFRKLVAGLNEQMRTLQANNLQMREALERIAREKITRPTSYADIVLGLGTDVPTQAALIASQALGGIQ